jgi:hypothetical protein
MSGQELTGIDLSARSQAILPRLPDRALRFRLTWTADDDDWFFELVNTEADPGCGVVRYRGTDFTPVLRDGLSRLRLDVTVDWLVDLRKPTSQKNQTSDQTVLVVMTASAVTRSPRPPSDA